MTAATNAVGEVPLGPMTEIKQQIRFCTTGDGGRIAVATVGTGQPLLRAGYWLSRVELDACSPVWMHWLRDLSREYSYIRYDQRGCGLSDLLLHPSPWRPGSTISKLSSIRWA